MNGKFPSHFDDGARPDDDGLDSNGLDPELLELFDTTARREAGAPGDRSAGPATGAAFVNSLRLKIQQQRRLRLLWQIAGLAAILVIGAFLAPQVAQQTLAAAGWFTERLPATGGAFVSPIGYLCASLLAWRVARWARLH
jgi:hypothetical protein